MIRFNTCALAAVAALLALGAARAADEPPEPLAATAHVARAHAIAGRDLAPIADGYLCRSPAGGGQYLRSLVAGAPPRQSFQAFDNLYYVGMPFVGAWILKTGQGLIVWDALDNAGEAETILEPGMRAFGLDPRDIKYLIITHGHFDHFGGAKRLQDTYHPKVLASAADWDFMADEKIREANHWPAIPPPTRDGVVKDGDELTLGGASVRFVLTPGHTPGTVSSIFTVRDAGRPVTVSMWGGTAMPDTAKGLGQYHDSFHKFWAAAKAAGAAASISSHPFVADNAGQAARRGQGKGRGKANPFVLRGAGHERMMAIYDECIEAQSARYAAWGR